jgi:hypothetical protein
MLYERKDLPEMHYIRHLHDDITDYVPYEKMILDRTLSPHMYENNVMNNWLKQMQPLVAILFDQMNIMKNFKNYIVDKYYYQQK